jgi:3-hydroxy-D-aspartate aldolase
MFQRPPAEPGSPLESLETPALLVDANALERNLSRMARFVSGSGTVLRAHAKSHKCSDIARRQIELGAVGVCCQTLREAEEMVAGGITDVLVTNQLVTAGKIDRLARLARRARIGVCVDDPENVANLSAAAVRHGVTVDVLVEINVGMNRCGVPPGAPALELARAIVRASGLRFAGLQAYHGTAQHLREHGERHAAISGAIALARDTRDLLVSSGIPCPVVTGAGTGTFAIEAASGVYTELQAGTYAFMDAAYSRNRTADGTPFDDFEQSLFVLTTVISHVSGDTLVVDAGLKAIGVDAGMPVVADVEGARYARASDEHGVLELAPGSRPLRVGDKLKLIPGNCDPTVNLYDNLIVVRNQRIEAVWRIVARGPGN